MSTHLKQGSVVVGVDGSVGGDAALAWAAHYALARRRPLLLATAAGEPTAGHQLFGEAESRHDLRVAARRVSDRGLARVRTLAPGLDVEVTLPLHDPRAALLELAAEASLLVLGTRGLGPVRALLLGSVSAAISSHASCSVAVVRSAGAADGPVVVGVDTDPSSTAALEFGFDLASVDHRRLDVVHSWSNDDTFVDWSSFEQRHELIDAHDRALGETLAGYGEKYPDVNVARHLPDGGPGRRLVELSAAASSIVVGSHNRTGLRSIFASVSREVVESAHCTVVVARG